MHTLKTMRQVLRMSEWRIYVSERLEHAIWSYIDGRDDHYTVRDRLASMRLARGIALCHGGELHGLS